MAAGKSARQCFLAGNGLALDAQVIDSVENRFGIYPAALKDDSGELAGILDFGQLPVPVDLLRDSYGERASFAIFGLNGNISAHSPNNMPGYGKP
jgi:hypothetical protein